MLGELAGTGGFTVSEITGSGTGVIDGGAGTDGSMSGKPHPLYLINIILLAKARACASEIAMPTY